MSINMQGLYDIRESTDLFLSQRVSYVASGNGQGQPEYVGYAMPGTVNSDAFWSIKRLTYDANHQVTTIEWANGTNDFGSVWNDRATESYS